MCELLPDRSQFRGTGVMGLVRWGRVCCDGVGERVIRILSTSIRNRGRQEDGKAHVKSHPRGLRVIFMHGNAVGATRVSRTIPSRRFLSAEEYPGSNTSRSQKCQAANDTSNNGTHILRRFLRLVVVVVVVWLVAPNRHARGQ